MNSPSIEPTAVAASLPTAVPPVPWALPLILSVVAGYVDGCTYLGLFGVFVAQITGSFVLVGVQLIATESGAVAKMLALPAFILAGMGVTVVVSLMQERPRAAFAVSLLLEACLIAGFMLTWYFGQPFRSPDEPGAVIALIFAMTAMGAQSALVRLLLRGLPSTNVMTTNSTMLAINAAELMLALFSGPRADEKRSKARAEVATLLLIGFGFLAGVLLGSIAFLAFGLGCVLLAVLPIVGIAVWTLAAAEAP